MRTIQRRAGLAATPDMIIKNPLLEATEVYTAYPSRALADLGTTEVGCNFELRYHRIWNSEKQTQGRPCNSIVLPPISRTSVKRRKRIDPCMKEYGCVYIVGDLTAKE